MPKKVHQVYTTESGDDAENLQKPIQVRRDVDGKVTRTATIGPKSGENFDEWSERMRAEDEPPSRE